MRLLSGAFLFCFLSAASCADPVPPAPTPAPAVTLDLGKPVTVEIGRVCMIEAKTTAKRVTWRVPSTVDMLPVKDGKFLALWAKEGTYTITAMVPNGDDVLYAETTITIIGPRPPPPPPPVPDALIGLVQAAYDADQSSTKAADKTAMAAVFTALAGAVDDTAVKTAGDLYSLNKNAMANRLSGRLGGVGKVLATDFATIFPAGVKESYILTPADRAAAKVKLAKYAEILVGVK